MSRLRCHDDPMVPTDSTTTPNFSDDDTEDRRPKDTPLEDVKVVKRTGTDDGAVGRGTNGRHRLDEVPTTRPQVSGPELDPVVTERQVQKGSTRLGRTVAERTGLRVAEQGAPGDLGPGRRETSL